MKDLPGYNSVLQMIPDHPGSHQGIRLFVKRDDLVHPLVQGNKWRKLHLTLQRLQSENIPGILSFGGAFSNYLQALAQAGPLYGLRTAAILRGTAIDLQNPTLAEAQAQGMALHPVSKADYDLKQASEVIQKIVAMYPNYALIPEGGATKEGIMGCMDIGAEIQAQLPAGTEQYWVAVPAGTGCTAAGLCSGLPAEARLLVFPAAAYGVDAGSIHQMILAAGFQPSAPLTIHSAYQLGRFARPPAQVIDFAHNFEKKYGITLDPIYTARMMYGLFDLLENRYFPDNSTLVAVHTGGLQGWRGFNG